MINPLTRRTALKLIATATVVGAASGTKTASAANAPARTPGAQSIDAWSRTHDRVWLGGEFWANPMEDWQIADGGAECPPNDKPSKTKEAWLWETYGEGVRDALNMGPDGYVWGRDFLERNPAPGSAPAGDGEAVVFLDPLARLAYDPCVNGDFETCQMIPGKCGRLARNPSAAGKSPAPQQTSENYAAT